MEAGDKNAFYVAGAAKLGHSASGSGCAQPLGADLADTSLGGSGAGGQVLTLYGVPDSIASNSVCSEQSHARPGGAHPTEPTPTPVPLSVPVPLMSLPTAAQVGQQAPVGYYMPPPQHYFSMPAAPAVYFAAQTAPRQAHAFASPQKAAALCAPMADTLAAAGNSPAQLMPVTQLYAAHSYSSGSDPYSSIVSASQTSPSARLM